MLNKSRVMGLSSINPLVQKLFRLSAFQLSLRFRQLLLLLGDLVQLAGLLRFFQLLPAFVDLALFLCDIFLAFGLQAGFGTVSLHFAQCFFSPSTRWVLPCWVA